MVDISVQILQAELDSVEAEIEQKVGDKLQARDSLRDAIKKLTRSAGTANGAKTSAVVVDDAELIATVRKLIADGADGVTSSDIAKALGVDTRSVARKLARLATDGKLGGDKEAGYAVA